METPDRSNRGRTARHAPETPNRSIAASALMASVALLERFHFAGVHVAGISQLGALQDLPVLLMASHVSWWDGFLLRHVARALPGRRTHLTVMSTGELARHPYLRRIGAVGVDASLSSIRALDRLLAARAHGDGGLVVSFFPQGSIWPSRRRPLTVRRGVVHVVEQLAPVLVVPVALHIEPLATMRPHAFVLAGTPRLVRDRTDAHELELALRRPLDALLNYLDSMGERAASEWPDGIRA